MKFDPTQFNFDRCEDEPIHRPEAIQGFGYLLAIDPDTKAIAIHSNNIDSLFAVSKGDKMVGANLAERLDPKAVSWEFLHKSYKRAEAENVRLPVELKFHAEFMEDEDHTEFHAVVYGSGSLMVVEIEPASLYSELVTARQYGKIYASNVAPTFGRLQSVNEVTQTIADSIRELTAFERVLIYRFNDDDTGTVISESKVDDIESYLDFHYPASDIPKQARELYRKNWIRINPDVEVEPVGLTPSIETCDRVPIDLTQSIIRAMSPIHLQYIRNQGIRSVMSISLINRDKLWGLISCHHRDTHYLPQNIRLECESLGHLFGWQIYAKEEEVYLKTRMETDSVINSLIEGLGDGDNIVEIFRRKERSILELMDASGFVYFAGDDMVTIGQTPEPDIVKRVANWASGQKGDESYQSTNLADVLGESLDSDGVCGALVIPIITEEGYFTIWFRPEFPHVIKWAGNPTEKSHDAPKRERLTPRVSFTLHEEKVENQSKPWSKSDLEIARRFNRLFLRHALQRKIEMQENIDQLEVRDKMKNEFLATLAHELRNPLSPISNALSLLKSSYDEEDRKIAFEIAGRQLKNLTTLVDDLLDVSRITRGKIRLKEESVDLKNIIKSAIELNQSLIESEGHELERNLPPEPLIVCGDFTRLSQSIGNILNNAAKYTPSGGKISISLSKEHAYGVVTIRDNGIGIPDTYLSRIFDIFTQVDAGSTHTRGGLGIGLTLTKKLIEIQKGTITVESEGLGKGSCFTIRLPLEGVDQADADTAQAPAIPSSRNRKILLVEDQPDVAKMFGLLLKRKGYEVVICHSAEKALEVFEETAPDVALIDIGLPTMDGYELCRKLRMMPAGRSTIMIAQTGWGQPEHQRESVDAGFNYHLVKPVDEETLDSTLAEAFSE